MEEETKLQQIESLGSADQQATEIFRSEKLEDSGHGTLLDPNDKLIPVKNPSSLATLKEMVETYQQGFKGKILDALNTTEEEMNFNDLAMLTPYEVVIGDTGNPGEAYRYTLCGVDISKPTQPKLTIRKNNVLSKKGQAFSITETRTDESPKLEEELFSGVEPKTLEAQLFSKTPREKLAQQLFPGSKTAEHGTEIPIPNDFPLDVTDERVKGLAFQPAEDYLISLRRLPKSSTLFEGDLQTTDVGDNNIWFVKKR